MRLFVAVVPPDPELDRIESLIREWKRVFPQARWCHREQLHLTLRFLGEVGDDLFGSVEDAIETTVNRWPAIVDAELRVGPGGGFPSFRRPRVLWLGVTPSELLERIAADLEAALLDRGIPGEDRSFQPHLTVGRLRRPWSRGELDDWKDQAHESGPPWHGRSVCLIRSHLGPAGARYETVARFPRESAA